MKVLKKYAFFEKMKIKKEIIGENKVNRGREVACSTSYPSGNQVDGLPLVAIAKRKSRRPRMQVHLTMINMFLNVIASRKCLEITIIRKFS